MGTKLDQAPRLEPHNPAKFCHAAGLKRQVRKKMLRGLAQKIPLLLEKRRFSEICFEKEKTEFPERDEILFQNILG